jgi:hypothetical protein
MIGAIIGGALGAAGSIFGNIAKKRALRRQKQVLQDRKNANEDWFNRRYNEDATQRADAQRLLTMTEEAIKQRNKAAEGRRAVMGGTDESVAAEKEAGNKAYADVVSQIAASAADRKDAIERQYQERKEGYCIEEEAKIQKEGVIFRGGGLFAVGICGGAALSLHGFSHPFCYGVEHHRGVWCLCSDYMRKG